MMVPVLISSTLLLTQFAIGKEWKKDIQAFNDSLNIAAMVGEDQSARFGFTVMMKKGYSIEELKTCKEVGKRTEDIDARNLKKMKNLVKKWGWFTISKFGSYTSHNAWLLVQHSDSDVLFQEECLKQIEIALKKKDVNPENYAYLFDRVAINRSRLQRYGTQGECKGPGKWVPKTMEEPEKLEQRRKEIGLPLMSIYTEEASKLCN